MTPSRPSKGMTPSFWIARGMERPSARHRRIRVAPIVRIVNVSRLHGSIGGTCFGIFMSRSGDGRQAPTVRGRERWRQCVPYRIGLSKQRLRLGRGPAFLVGCRALRICFLKNSALHGRRTD
jgi:hypothetical protein